MRAVGGVGESGVVGRPSGSLPPTTDLEELCGRLVFGESGVLGARRGRCLRLQIGVVNYAVGWVFWESGVVGRPSGSLPPTTDWGELCGRVGFLRSRGFLGARRGRCLRLQIGGFLVGGWCFLIFDRVMMMDDWRAEESAQRLRRLSRVWVEEPVFFVTVCVAGRRAVLANEGVHGVLREVWQTGSRLHGWQVGRYVIMPDHVHLFCSPNRDAAGLSEFVGGWKEWSCKSLRRRLGLVDFQWQPNFFDHVLRSAESYSEKWQYVRSNPLRAGLVVGGEEWPFAGHLDFE